MEDDLVARRKALDSLLHENEARTSSHHLPPASTSRSSAGSSSSSTTTTTAAATSTGAPKKTALSLSLSVQIADVGGSFDNKSARGSRFSAAVTELINSPEKEMLKFGLPSNHPVTDIYACAYYPKKKKVMVQGKMYVTPYFLAFSGWPLELRILLPLRDVKELQKARTLSMFENAIVCTTSQWGDFFFASFLDRDQSFYTLKSAIAMQNHLHELKSISSTDDGSMEATMQDEVPLAGLELGIQITRRERERSRAGTNPPHQPSSPHSQPASPTSESPPSVGPSKAGDKGRDKEEEEAELGYDIITSTRARSITRTVPLVKSLLTDSDSTLLLDVLLQAPVGRVFKECWLHSRHIRDFLVLCGESDVVGSEWAPMSDSNVKIHPADKSRFPFAYSRTLTFKHLRSFLALPLPGLSKFSSCTATQYLYLFGSRPRRRSSKPAANSSSSSSSGSSSGSTSGHWSLDEALGECRPQRGVVLTVTEITSSLPFAGITRVLTYWIFEQSGIVGLNGNSSNASTTRVRCCVQVPVHQSLTGFMQHLVDGLIDRAGLQSRQLHAYQVDRIDEYRREEDQGVASESNPIYSQNSVDVKANQSKWSPRELQRITRFKRSLQIKTLQEVKLAQTGPGGFRAAGRNSAARLYHHVVLVASLLVLFIMCGLQQSSNAVIASRLRVLDDELAAMLETLQARAAEQAEMLESVSAPPVPAPTLAAWLPTSITGTAPKTEL